MYLFATNFLIDCILLFSKGYFSPCEYCGTRDDNILGISNMLSIPLFVRLYAEIMNGLSEFIFSRTGGQPSTTCINVAGYNYINFWKRGYSSFLGTDVSPFPNFNNSVLTTRRNLLLHC